MEIFCDIKEERVIKQGRVSAHLCSLWGPASDQGLLPGCCSVLCPWHRMCLVPGLCFLSCCGININSLKNCKLLKFERVLTCHGEPQFTEGDAEILRSGMCCRLQQSIVGSGKVPAQCPLLNLLACLTTTFSSLLITLQSENISLCVMI